MRFSISLSPVRRRTPRRVPFRIRAGRHFPNWRCVYIVRPAPAERAESGWEGSHDGRDPWPGRRAASGCAWKTVLGGLGLFGRAEAPVWVAYWPSLKHCPRADQWQYLLDTLDRQRFRGPRRPHLLVQPNPVLPTGGRRAVPPAPLRGAGGRKGPVQHKPMDAASGWDTAALRRDVPAVAAAAARRGPGAKSGRTGSGRRRPAADFLLTRSSLSSPSTRP